MTTQTTQATCSDDVADYLREMNATLERCQAERDKVSIELLCETNTLAKRQLRINLRRMTEDIKIAVAAIKSFKKIFGVR